MQTSRRFLDIKSPPPLFSPSDSLTQMFRPSDISTHEFSDPLTFLKSQTTTSTWTAFAESRLWRKPVRGCWGWPRLSTLLHSYTTLWGLDCLIKTESFSILVWLGRNVWIRMPEGLGWTRNQAIISDWHSESWLVCNSESQSLSGIFKYLYSVLEIYLGDSIKCLSILLS
jgi:hypothetical protein